MNRVERNVVLGFVLVVLSCGGPPDELQVEDRDDGLIRLSAEQIAVGDVRIEAVSLMDVPIPTEIPGTVMTPDTAAADVGSIVEGRVERVHVVPGDRVRAGAELVRIHAHELDKALRDRSAADAQVTYAKAAFERSEQLFAAGAVSREEVERRRALLTEAEAEATRAERFIEHLNPSADGHVVVVAPKNGTVFAVHVRPGAAVVPGQSLVELGATDVLWVAGFVPETRALRLAVGDGAAVTFRALPSDTVDARVVAVGAVVDSLRRAVEMRVELAAIPEGVRPGIFASIILSTSDGVSRAVLPAESVQRVDGREVVFVEEQHGAFRPVQVEAAQLLNGMLAVEGLEDGAAVAVSGAYIIRAVLEGTLPDGAGTSE